MATVREGEYGDKEGVIRLVRKKEEDYGEYEKARMETMEEKAGRRGREVKEMVYEEWMGTRGSERERQLEETRERIKGELERAKRKPYVRSEWYRTWTTRNTNYRGTRAVSERWRWNMEEDEKRLEEEMRKGAKRWAREIQKREEECVFGRETAGCVGEVRIRRRG